ncbi:MAG TPA: class I SAM-dependent methyltransferase, partial [Polyangiaceae bacterium]|nr:class I SAM-dependent methyltransferase [Polyangiaceae bacterium]
MLCSRWVSSGMTELEAELYALTHRGNPGDVEFYARASSGAARVLELGSGCGRLLPALSRSARSVIGLDRESWFLKAARSSIRRLGAEARGRVQLTRGDLRAFELGLQFDRILLPYNTLYCLLNRRALAGCLRAVRSHLAPGGTFWFDVWCADGFMRQPNARARRDQREALVSLLHRGQVWDVFERSRLRSAEQRLDVIYRYVSRQRGTAIECSI